MFLFIPTKKPTFYFITLVIFIFIVFSPLSHSVPSKTKQPNTLHFATVDYPPWAYRENKQIKGISYDIIKSICNDIGVTLNIELLPARRIQQMLYSGEIDIASSIFNNKTSNNENLFFDNESFFQYPVSIITLKKTHMSIRTIEDLYIYRVGHILVSKEIESKILPNHQNRFNFHSMEALTKSLISGRVDAIIAAPAEIFPFIKQFNIETQVKIWPTKHSMGSYPVWSIRGILSKKPAIRTKFIASLKKHKRDGVIRDILKKHSNLQYFSDFEIPEKKQLNSNHE